MMIKIMFLKTKQDAPRAVFDSCSIYCNAHRCTIATQSNAIDIVDENK